MPSPYQLLVAGHALAGLVTLLSLPVPLVAPKGGRTHVVAGRVFFAGMCAVAVTGLLISLTWGLAPQVVQPGLLDAAPEQATRVRRAMGGFAVFFGTVGVLSLDAVFLGRTPFWHDRSRARGVESALGLALLLFGLALAGVAIRERSILFGAFAVFAVRGAWMPSRLEVRDMSRQERVVQHLQAMLGGATAAVTAFSALTLRRWLPEADAFGLLFWLLPVALGVIGTTVWTRRLASPSRGNWKQVAMRGRGGSARFGIEREDHAFDEVGAGG